MGVFFCAQMSAPPAAVQSCCGARCGARWAADVVEPAVQRAEGQPCSRFCSARKARRAGVRPALPAVSSALRPADKLALPFEGLAFADGTPRLDCGVLRLRCGVLPA